MDSGIQPEINILPFSSDASWLVTFFDWVIHVLVPALANFFADFFGLLVGLSFPLWIFFLIGIIYTVERLKEIRKKEEEIYDTKVEPAYETVDQGDPALAHRWETVLKHVESENQNDWKQAIIEADIILDDILTKMGYRGESVGEKLKRVEPGDFQTLNEAWEAHKVRNSIAHKGSDFVISQLEARRIVGLYKKVFEEFYYI